MKLREVLLAATFIAFILVLPSCGIGSAGTTGSTSSGGSTVPPATLYVSPIPGSIAVNSVVTFNVSTSSTSAPVWTLLDASAGNAGTLSFPNGSASAQYTAPPTPPIYATGGYTSNIQGQVQFEVEAFNSANQPTAQYFAIPITTPTVTAAITPATVTLALTGIQLFDAYAVGGTSNGIIFTVNGIVNGSAAVGTINSTGLYTAPATMPMSGPTVTITCTSTIDPTRSASAGRDAALARPPFGPGRHPTSYGRQRVDRHDRAGHQAEEP